MTQPNTRLLRRKVLADPADPDWAALQTAPPGAIVAPTAYARRLVVTPVARDAGGAVVSGVVASLQLVTSAIGKLPDELGGASVVVTSGATAEDAATGDALEYDVTGTTGVTVRVVDATDLIAAGATTLDLWFVPLAVPR